MTTSTAKKTVKKSIAKKNSGVVIPEPTTSSNGSPRTLYKFTGKKPEDCKTAQMRALVDTAATAKKEDLDSYSFTAQDLTKLAVKMKILATRQEPLRIFRFYAKRLTDEGYFVKV